MNKLSLFSSALLISSIAVAQADKTDKVASALTTKLDGTAFRATLSEGFHFNLEAPNQITIDGKGEKPASSTAHELKFQLKTAKFSSGRASLYVCDDALTFCQPNTIDLKPGSEAASDKDGVVKRPKKAKVNEFGFIEDDLQAAGNKAIKEKKLVLIDFSARWCPGCIRLENEVFGTKAFRDATKDLVKVRLDYDRFENLKIAKQYGIRAIPSLLVTTANLDEISRAVDFQPLPTLKTFFDDARKNPLSFSELQKKADLGDQDAALALGQRLYMSSQPAKAVDYLSRVTPAPIELADAKVQAAKEAMKADDKRKLEFQRVVREAIKAEPSSSRSLIWRTDLVDSLTDAAEKKNIGVEGLVVADKILAHPESLQDAMKGDAVGEFTGFERMYVASERADLAESAGLDEATQHAALLKVTEIGRELKIPVEKKGPALRFLIFLVAAKQYPEAETQARAMLKREPKNPELQRRLLRVLNGLQKYDEAIKVGRETLAQSFGKNEVWVAQQLAKAYVGAGKKLEAKALAQSYLARTDMDWSMMKSEEKDLADISKL